MANLEIKVDASGAFRDLEFKIANIGVMYKTWANHLEKRAVLAFKNQTAPDGTPWQALSPAYAAYKNNYGKRVDRLRRRAKKSGEEFSDRRGKPKNKILQWTGSLYQSVAASSDAFGARVGSNLAVGSYSLAAIHQFGAPRKNIPARPFLPMDAQGELLSEDQEELQRLAEQYFLS